MKRVKIKILFIILSSIVLLFAALNVIMSISIPQHFEKEAKNALQYQIDYAEQLLKSKTDDYSDVEDYVGTYFTGNINYIEIEPDETLTGVSENTTNSYKARLRNAENEILDYCVTHKIQDKQCYIHETDKGYYIFSKFKDKYWDEGISEYTTTDSIMYIDIEPIIQYARSLNWLLLGVFCCIALVMSIIGLRLGKQIEDSQKSERQFFQNSSHELKTPLMAIQGYAEGIQTGILTPRPSAEIIMQESERMTKLVEELLSISKIDAHQLKLNLVLTDIREILYDCLRSIEPMKLQGNIQVVPYFTDQPILVNCDEEQLKRAFLNILSNALRHCKNAVLIYGKTEKGTAVIKIKDDGSGISDADIPHVFDRFYTGKTGNTGIGLALTREIVNLHKGTITAYNNEIGAVFEIRLPL